MQYGHGLFGSQDEVHTSYLQAEANRNGWILVASDWLGLSEHVRLNRTENQSEPPPAFEARHCSSSSALICLLQDTVMVATIVLEDLSNFAAVVDRSHQGR